MGTLIAALFNWDTINYVRRVSKLALVVLFLDLLLLISAETAIVTIWHSEGRLAVAILGLIWIMASGIVVFLQGGPGLDAILVPKVLGTEIGEKPANALIAFFVAQVGITVFLFLVPVWKCWSAFFFFLVAIIGVVLCGFITNHKTNWNFWRAACIILAIITIGAIIFFAAFELVTDKPPDEEWVKRKAKGTIQFIKSAATPARKDASNAQEKIENTDKQVSKASDTVPRVCRNVYVPPKKIVNTFVPVLAGQKGYFRQAQPGTFKLHGKKKEKTVDSLYWEQTFVTSDYIWLRGHKKGTTVTVSNYPLG